MSMGAPAAITSADGFMESLSAHAIPPAPIAALAIVMRERRSRRLGWASDGIACDDMAFYLAGHNEGCVTGGCQLRHLRRNHLGVERGRVDRVAGDDEDVDK